MVVELTAAFDVGDLYIEENYTLPIGPNDTNIDELVEAIKLVHPEVDKITLTVMFTNEDDD